MNKLIFIILLFAHSTLFAQHFKIAPHSDRPVKKIIEWITYGLDNDNPETVKGYVYEFRRDGKPIFYHDHWNEKQQSWEYDEKGRITKMTKDTKGNRFETGVATTTYYPRKKIAHVKTEAGEAEAIRYLNGKDLPVEEKQYMKAGVTFNKKVLMQRMIYNYTDYDSLFGVMTYKYNFMDGTLKSKEKTIHHFDERTRQKTLSQYFAENGKIKKRVEYLYDENDRIAIIDTNDQTDEWERIEFRYKDGQLWQEIHYNYAEKEKETMVYKNGLPVRFKEYYNGKLFRYTDFQYMYW